ncbi:hypothetical protein [Leptolyngbya sp. 7M]|uniref:hypothetical protein n=1 Tax=Leptolyngbya sp. 7M TaxID=2812896 RepID=UPI001B8D4896|nr:hypothetical protein [Leptolyngbya sp. 7M]QYO63113.1 hypothetical protein JVX88_24565 [Leptolyngbya sp. 7M]
MRVVSATVSRILALLGFESLDYWNQTVNERVLQNEVKKLDAEGKRKLAEQLLREAEAMPSSKVLTSSGV